MVKQSRAKQSNGEAEQSKAKQWQSEKNMASERAKNRRIFVLNVYREEIIHQAMVMNDLLISLDEGCCEQRVRRTEGRILHQLQAIKKLEKEIDEKDA